MIMMSKKPELAIYFPAIRFYSIMESGFKRRIDVSGKKGPTFFRPDDDTRRLIDDEYSIITA